MLSTKLATIASKTISKYGAPVTFTRTIEGAFDPATGKDSTATTSTFGAFGIRDAFRSSEIDGTNIVNTDVRLFIKVPATVPAIDDTVTLDGVVYRVMNVTPVSPNNTIVLYDIQLRI